MDRIKKVQRTSSLKGGNGLKPSINIELKTNLKETTADKAQNALNRLSQGSVSINQVRSEFGLEPICDDSLNEHFVTKE